MRLPDLRPAAAHGEIPDEQVGWRHQGQEHPLEIRHLLQQREKLRHDGTAGNGHDQDGGTRACVPPQPLDGQREDGGPHHGIGEAQRRHEPHGDIALCSPGPRHRGGPQQGRQGKIAFLADHARDQHQPHDIAQHHAGKRQRGEIGRFLERQAERHAIDADGIAGHHLHPDIKEQRHGTQPEMAEAQQTAPVAATAPIIFRVQVGQGGTQDAKRQQGQDGGHGQIGAVHLLREAFQQRGAQFRCGIGHLRRQIAHALHDQQAEDDGGQHARPLVADAHDGDAPRGTFRRAGQHDIGIGRRLQHRQPATDDEQSRQRAGEPVHGDELPEQHGTHGHHAQAQRHAALHARAAQDGGTGQCQHQIGEVKHHRHQEGADIAELEGQLHEGDQRPVQPGDEAEDEEHGPQDRDGAAWGGGGRQFRVHPCFPCSRSGTVHRPDRLCRRPSAP